jgi:hypothetical protein
MPPAPVTTPYAPPVRPSGYGTYSSRRSAPPEVVLVGIGMFVIAALLFYLPLRYGIPALSHLFSSYDFERAFAAVALDVYLVFAASGAALIALGIGLLRGRKVSQYLTCLLCGIIAISEIVTIQQDRAALRGDDWDAIAVVLVCIAVAVLVAVLPGARHHFQTDDAGPVGVVIASVIGVCLGACLMLDGLLLIILGTVETKFVGWGLVTLALGAAMIGASGPLRAGVNAARIAVSLGYLVYIVIGFVVGHEMGATASFGTLVPFGLALTALGGLWLSESSTAHFGPAGPVAPLRNPLGVAHADMAPPPGPIGAHSQPPPPPSWPGAYPSPARAGTNTLAIVAFVLSFFFAIPGIVCGHVALSQLRRTGERGRGFAIAALVLGYSALLFFVILWATLIALVH